MLRAIILLVATLAAFALAAPAPLPAVKRSSEESFGKKLHSFKSFTHGHRGRKHNPVAELSRIAHKFHWSLSLPTPFGSITVDLPNGTTDSYDFPDDGSASSPSSGSGDSGSDGTSSGGNSSDDGYGSSGSGEVSPDDGGYGSSGGGDGSLGDGVGVSSIQTSITTAPTATYSPPSYATDDPYDAESTNVNIFTSSRAFSTRVSTTTSAAATASASASTGGGEGEVNAHPEENESEYLSPVTIGGQKLNLNFDTGSADL